MSGCHVDPKLWPLHLFFYFSSVMTSFADWYKHLGHQANKVFDHLVSSYFLHFYYLKQFHYNSCKCNKTHKLRFHISSVSSSQPLQLIYFYVWGLVPIPFRDGFRYYVIFVDHFLKYI